VEVFFECASVTTLKRCDVKIAL